MDDVIVAQRDNAGLVFSQIAFAVRIKKKQRYYYCKEN
jgi:hypothetical protein